MGHECLVSCDGATLRGRQKKKNTLSLRLWGLEKNVNFEISDIDRSLAANIPDRLRDLLHIAAYVYCADQAFPRGGPTDQADGKRWHRKFTFAIPVRDFEFWSAEETCSQLQHTLGFLSDDSYDFLFEKLKDGPSINDFFDFGAGGGSGFTAESVCLFSGGVDSLGGAVQESLVEQRKVVLVSHRSTPKIDPKQRALVKLLETKCKAQNLLHVPVWVNKDSGITREHTQRTRSFLYASLAATIAQIFRLPGIYFYENGITSMNLPISPQLIGARASRTTHPVVLSDFAKLLSMILDRTFDVHNPFLRKTKTEIINTIGDCGAAELLKDAISCSHTWERTNQHSHCGRCFQCVGRRFAMLASRYGAHDPAASYKIDLLTGARAEPEDITLIESFVRTAKDMLNLSEDGFFQKFGETSRIVRHLDGSADENARRIFELHRRHAGEVDRVVVEGMKENTQKLKDGLLPSTCLVVLAVHKKYRGRGRKHKRGEHVFRKEGDKWVVRYDGKRLILNHSIGLEYIEFLLKNPNQEFGVADLYFQLRGRSSLHHRPMEDEELRISGVGKGEPLHDEKTGKETSRKLNELRDELDFAEETGNEDRKAEILEEMQKIYEYRKSSSGWRGRTRRSHDEMSNIRISVTNAINRMKRHISNEHRSLGEHLTLRIITGNFVRYNPPEKFPRWQ